MVAYANDLGLNAIGVDGDNSIVRHNSENIFIHDYTKGEFLTDRKFDLGWSVEFLEHVEKYSINYFNTFKNVSTCFALLHQRIGGYHHVNTQNVDYWLNLFKKTPFFLKKS